MIMPIPSRSEYHVELFHPDPLTMNSGEASGPFYDESQGECRVAVRRSRFIGENELEASVEGVGCIRTFY